MEGGGRFPIRRIFCVGRNYADHVVEMGGQVERNPPTFFTKPADAAICEPASIAYSLATDNLHYEVEWVVALYGGGVHLDPAAAGRLVGASAVGIDLTRRDLQSAAKKAGDPWDMGKAFDDSAPLGALRPGKLTDIAPTSIIQLAVNGETRQRATLDQMLWTVPELLSYLSQRFELRAGDLVFTGTPAGVGPLVPGDKIDARIEGLSPLSFRVDARA